MLDVCAQRAFNMYVDSMYMGAGRRSGRRAVSSFDAQLLDI